ncbi:hypothetical protein [Escherichia coli]|uniref:hypothetical protein n=1 Tax=Escherichia coli TaxID=562 RepID=UPI0021CFD126|nr:hypothetical protein [Escherichia coli]MCU6294511.1 hypothetical protein [Escherichia coli]
MLLNDIQFTYKFLYIQYATVDAGEYLYNEIYRSVWIKFLDELHEYYHDLCIVRDNKIYKFRDIVSHSGKLRLELSTDSDRDVEWIGVNLLELENEKQLKGNTSIL